MGKFLTGLLMGVGIGLLVAPRRGEEMRHLVGENIGRVRGSLPENMQNMRLKAGRSSSGMIKDVEEYYQPELSKQGNRPLESAGSASSGMRQSGSNPASSAKSGTSGMADSLRSNNPDFLKDQNKAGGTSMSGTQRPLETDINDPRKPSNPDNRPPVPPGADPNRPMPRPEKRDAGDSPPLR